MVWRNVERSCESRYGSSENKVQITEMILPDTEYISMLFIRTNACNIIYHGNKPDINTDTLILLINRYFNL